MRTRIEIDDVLLAQAMRVTKLKTKTAVVNEALRRMVGQARLDAIRALEGLGWEGDLRALRKTMQARPMRR